MSFLVTWFLVTKLFGLKNIDSNKSKTHQTNMQEMNAENECSTWYWKKQEKHIYAVQKLIEFEVHIKSYKKIT